ncbi:MAG: hypothetical protein ABI550_02035, partial [Ignavibacteriaceae bacterium]
AQYHVYYYLGKDFAIISSELSSFCRLLGTTEFNEKWLYEYIYFNFPLGKDTFLKNINILSHASILTYNIKSKKKNIKKYADVFQKREPLLNGSEALNYAKDIFADRIPIYFEGSEKIACAITGGWDGRTNVALSPDKTKITTYTYGGKNCADLVLARLASKDANVKHLEMFFDNNVINDLPAQMLETVYLTSGAQGILRSTLLKVYKKLSEFPLVIVGNHYDGLFRGNVGGVSLVSKGVANVMKNGMNAIETESFKGVFNNNFEDFVDVIKSKFNYVESEFGDLQSTEAQINYGNYIMSSRYFGGEYKIAELFTTLRVPAWDSHLIDLAFSIEQSTLTFSEYKINKRGARETMLLQAYLISQFAPELLKTPIKLTNPNVVLKGNLDFKTYSYYRKIINKFKNSFYRNHKTLENWNSWLNVTHKNFVDNLIFSKNSLIQEYFTEKYLNNLKIERDYRIIGKLLTTEIILKLINNKWQRFW